MNCVSGLKNGQFETFPSPPTATPKRGGTQTAFLSRFARVFAKDSMGVFTFVEMCKVGPFLRGDQMLCFLGVFLVHFC